jgi:hypothetical protein
MKIAKALKLKNQLAGEAAHLKELLTKQNSRSTKQKFDYNNHEILTQLRAKLDALVKVKAAIARANGEIYAKIFRLAELKGLVALLNTLDTKCGIFYETAGYGETAHEVDYAVQINKVEVDRLANEAKEEIQQLQDELDEFNFTHNVEL